MNFTVEYQIDDVECEATVSHGDTAKHFMSTNVPGLLKKVNDYITDQLQQAGINTGIV